MELFDLLLFVHLVAAMIWIGGALVGMLIGNVLAAGDDADAFGRFCTAFATIAGPMFGGSALVVLGTGIWMVADSGSIELGATWVWLSLVGWLVSTVMGATVVGMSWTRLGQAVRAGTTLVEAAPAISRAQLLTWIDLALRVGIVALMVWQPG